MGGCAVCYSIVQLSEEVIERLLDRWPVARLATSGAAGPHQVPIVFARSGGRLWSPVDGKPKSGGELARVRFILADPRVSLLLDDYDRDWTQLWWLRVDAEARVVRPARPGVDAEVAAALAALRAKYPQYASVPLLRDPPTLLAFQPRAIRSWRASADASPAVC
jgi:PPOX class probable F420-dependent enzyme